MCKACTTDFLASSKQDQPSRNSHPPCSGHMVLARLSYTLNSSWEMQHLMHVDNSAWCDEVRYCQARHD